MATSFKIKAVEELRKAKQIEREAEAMAHAQSVAAKYAKNVANEKRIAAKMARIEKGEHYKYLQGELSALYYVENEIKEFYKKQ